MVTVVLYAQPSRDEEKEPRLEKIESIEGFESFEIMGKKLSMFQIIGVVFAVTFLVLLIWSAYRKRERQRRIKEGAKDAIETYQATIMNTQLLTPDEQKTVQGNRSNSIEEIVKTKIEETLNTTKKQAIQSVNDSNYSATEKTAIRDRIQKDFTENYKSYERQLVENVGKTVGRDVYRSAGQKMDRMLKPLSEKFQIDAGAIAKSAYTEQVQAEYNPKQAVAPKPGLLTRLFGRR